jgi:hypothetical protein
MQKLEQERTLNEQIRKELPQAVPKRAVGSSALGGLSGLPDLNTKGGLGFKKPKLEFAYRGTQAQTQRFQHQTT